MDPETIELGLALPTDQQIMDLWDLTTYNTASPNSQERELAVSALLARQEVQMRRVAWRLLGNHHTAEDALQVARLRVVRSLGPDIDPFRFPAWVHTLTRNACLTHLEQVERYRRATTAVDLQDASGSAIPFDPVSHVEPEVSDVLADTESREAVLAIIAQWVSSLSPRDQALWNAIHFEEKKAEQVASELGMSAGNVYVRLSRLRTMCRVYLEERGVEMGDN